MYLLVHGCTPPEVVRHAKARGSACELASDESDPPLAKGPVPVTNQHDPIPHFNVQTTTYDPAPEVNGFKKWLYESPDGAVKGGSFKENGRFEVVMPCDEFLYVVAGSTKLTFKNGDTLQLAAGELSFLRKGLAVTFETSADYHDVSIFISPDKVNG